MRPLHLRSALHNSLRHSSPPSLFLRRHASTSQPPTFLRRNRLPIFLTTLSAFLGVSAGTFLNLTLAPPTLPAAGTPEDLRLLSDLSTQLDSNFKVQVLRGKCLGTARQLSGRGPSGWVELEPPPPPPLPSSTPNSSGSLLTHLTGIRGLGVERLFWDQEKSRLTAVVWFGGGMAGWPGVTHGGMLATALTEKVVLAQHLFREGVEEVGAGHDREAGEERREGTGRHARARIPAAVGAKAAQSQPAELSLTYKRPTFANAFYVIRVTPGARAGLEEGETKEGRVGVALPVDGGLDWEASIETLDAKVCVLAQARFAAGEESRIGRAERKVVKTAGRSYQEFRDWMWPSRQKESQMG